MSFASFKAAIQYAHEQRQNKGTFDVVFSTSLLPGDHILPLTERIAQYAEVGITWLLEQLYPQHFGGEWQGFGRWMQCATEYSRDHHRHRQYKL
jgi:hypothetical protein